MFITTQNEIKSLMPTARWDHPDELKGYLEEEERVALEPLLGTPLYLFLCNEYERLRNEYVDITSSTITPIHKAKRNPGVPYASVTDKMDMLQSHALPAMQPLIPQEEDTDEVDHVDMQLVHLIRICQQIEFYRMLAHKTGMLTVSFNEGGGMNMVSADGYDPADEKRMERVVKDAFMSAGRATDSLLLFLEADAKGERLFTKLWKHADAFYLHKDLLFQTARVMKEFLGTKIDRMTYMDLVHDIRYCQNTYLKVRIGARLLKAVVDYANGPEYSDDSDSSDSGEEEVCTPIEVYDELLSLLRTALAFYVECRRVEIGPKQEKLARRDSMTDAQQAMAAACQYVEENLDAFGDDAKDSPIYKKVKAEEAQKKQEEENLAAARMRHCRKALEQSSRKLFTSFPATHITPEHK